MGFGVKAVATFVELTDTPDSISDGDVFYGLSSAVKALTKGFEGHYLKQGATVPVWSAVKGKPQFRFVTLLPEEAVLPATGGAAVTKTDGTNFSYNTLDFDADTEESAYWVFNLSPDYAGEDIFVIIRWKSTATTGDVKWGLSVLGREEGEVWDAALGTEQTVVSTTADVAGELVYSTILPFPPNLSPNDTVIVKLARKAADAADTMAADACVTECFLVWATVSVISTFTPITPTEVTPGVAGSWEDVDCSALIASGATGVIIHWENADPTTNRDLGLRKKGSTDDRHDDVVANSHGWAWVGVDEDRYFQAYVSTVTDQHIWVVAYTTVGAPFFMNGKDRSLTGTGAWTDIDLAAACPGAKLIMVETVSTYVNSKYGVRKNGSTDDRYQNVCFHSWAIIGCDDDQVIEGYISSTDVDFFIVGYATEGVSMRTNGVNVSPTADGAYHVVDCSDYAPGANMIFFEVINTNTEGETGAGEVAYAIRKNGSTEDIYRNCGLTTYTGHYFAAVECDEEQKVEIKLEDAAVQIWLLGYSVPA